MNVGNTRNSLKNIESKFNEPKKKPAKPPKENLNVTENPLTNEVLDMKAVSLRPRKPVLLKSHLYENRTFSDEKLKELKEDVLENNPKKAGLEEKNKESIEEIPKFSAPPIKARSIKSVTPAVLPVKDVTTPKLTREELQQREELKLEISEKMNSVNRSRHYSQNFKSKALLIQNSIEKWDTKENCDFTDIIDQINDLLNNETGLTNEKLIKRLKEDLNKFCEGLSKISEKKDREINEPLIKSSRKTISNGSITRRSSSLDKDKHVSSKTTSAKGSSNKASSAKRSSNKASSGKGSSYKAGSGRMTERLMPTSSPTSGSENKQSIRRKKRSALSATNSSGSSHRNVKMESNELKSSEITLSASQKHGRGIHGEEVFAEIDGEFFPIKTNDVRLPTFRGYIIKDDNYDFNSIQKDGYKAPYLFFKDDQFPEHETVLNIALHQSENPKRSAYISTSKDINVSYDFLKIQLKLAESSNELGEVKKLAIDFYNLPKARGIDIVKTLGLRARHPEEEEVSIPGTLKSHNYLATIVMNFIKTGEEEYEIYPERIIINESLQKNQLYNLLPELIGSYSKLSKAALKFDMVFGLLEMVHSSAGVSFFKLNTSSIHLDNWYRLLVNRGVGVVQQFIEKNKDNFINTKIFERILLNGENSPALITLLSNYIDQNKINEFVGNYNNVKKIIGKLKNVFYIEKKDFEKVNNRIKNLTLIIEKNPNCFLHSDFLNDFGPKISMLIRSGDEDILNSLSNLLEIINKDEMSFSFLLEKVNDRIIDLEREKNKYINDIKNLEGGYSDGYYTKEQRQNDINEVEKEIFVINSFLDRFK
jgi:hypothetical protein